MANPQDDLPTVSPAFGFAYLAEGGANVLFRLTAPADALPPAAADAYGPDTPPPTELEDWQAAPWPYARGTVLLRARKAAPGATGAADAAATHAAVIAPLLAPDLLAEQHLVQLAPGTLAELDAQLVALEAAGRRPERRRGTYLRDDGYASVVQDLSPRPGADACTVEIKPKWLVQSPAAPPGAVRCRTCALRAMREARGKGAGSATCPLRLLPENELGHAGAVAGILAAHGIGASNELVTERLRGFLARGRVLAQLRELQVKYNTDGMLDAAAAHMNMRIAMTIRDCAVFIRIPADPAESIEARIADLDLKSPEKLPQWQATERSLLEGSWYMGADSRSAADGAACLLSE